MLRMHFECTDQEDGGGPMFPRTLNDAPTWALQKATGWIEDELRSRYKVMMLVREEMQKLGKGGTH